MRKLFYTLIAALTIQIGLAQASNEAKTYINNSGIIEQIQAYKSQITPIILEDNLENFNKEFDAVFSNYISEFENLIDESFEAEDVKKHNENFAANATTSQLNPKDLVAFQQKSGSIQEKFSLSLQEIIVKYGDPAILEQM